MYFIVSYLFLAFLQKDFSKGEAEVTGERVKRGAGYGVEVRGTFRLFGNKDNVERLQMLCDPMKLHSLCCVLSHVYVCMFNFVTWISTKVRLGHCRLQYKNVQPFSCTQEVSGLSGEFCLVLHTLVHEVLSAIRIS